MIYDSDQLNPNIRVCACWRKISPLRPAGKAEVQEGAKKEKLPGTL